MGERPYRRRRGGSLVFPILLIIIGVLFLLDNLNITSGIDWGTIWKLWPILIIAIGLEILLGRRVSFGAVLLMIILLVIAGSIAWWSVVVDSGERTTKHFTWPTNGVERAEVELDLGAGRLQLGGYDDMADLIVADLELAPGIRVSEDLKIDADVARGWISSDAEFFAWVPVLGGKASEWDLLLNSRVRWELDVNSGAGDVRLDLSELRVSDLKLDAGVGSVHVTLPRRGSVKARIDGGIGDVRVTIPEGVQARFRVDRGIGDLTVGSRFKRRGDYYETEGFSRAESYIELEIDIGIGSITVR